MEPAGGPAERKKERKMEFVIVTGLSGAGKTRAMHAMEDIGFTASITAAGADPGVL